MAHEQAHASAAGSLGGGIHLEYDANGIPIGGSVQIAMPALDFNNPERTYSLARQVQSAAQAPGGDMSAADSKVAQSAGELMGRAQVLMGQKNLAHQRVKGV
ncbi:MAG: hypothetical protein VKJ04_08555 [Vampirovibrionales bacterium]|nr:hypothetical protein [Vampirovibrionales bacterium]